MVHMRQVNGARTADSTASFTYSDEKGYLRIRVEERPARPFNSRPFGIGRERGPGGDPNATFLADDPIWHMVARNRLEGEAAKKRALEARRDAVRDNAKQRMLERRQVPAWIVESQRARLMRERKAPDQHAKHVKQARYAVLPLAVVAFPIINTLRYFAGMDDLEWWYA